MQENIAKQTGLRRTDARTQQRMVAAMGAIFGLFLIFGVGFAHSDVLHNAAHDARHSFAFPCH
jgi:cobalt transporter subunit CbtB